MTSIGLRPALLFFLLTGVKTAASDCLPQDEQAIHDHIDEELVNRDLFRFEPAGMQVIAL